MGCMTTITILNDDWLDIEHNPKKFVDDISEGMNGMPLYLSESIRDNIHTYQFHEKIAKAHDEVNPALYLAYDNTMSTFGYSNDFMSIERRKEYLKIAKQQIQFEESRIKELEKQFKK